MQGISATANASSSLKIAATDNNKIQSELPGGLLYCLKGVVNTITGVITTTAHAAPSSPWNYDRLGKEHPLKSVVAFNPKTERSDDERSISDHFYTECAKHTNNSSALRGIMRDSLERDQQMGYDKASRPEKDS